MKVYLIRSKEISIIRFRIISEIVQKFRGPIEFIFQKEDITEESDEEEGRNITKVMNNDPDTLETLKWDTLFRYCEDFRKQNKKIKPEDLVVFLTDHQNERNWFSSWDESGKRNFFIQTSGWEMFIESGECYPVIYELATIPLILSTCKDLAEVEEMAHRNPPVGTGPRGCPWDYCENKIQVQLRLRTGDICPDCRKKMIEKEIDPALARQVFAIMDDIRGQMLFRKQFGITKQLSRLELNLANEKLLFTDIGNISAGLNASELTIYWYFLRHPEGVEYAYVADDIEEIKFLYRHFTSDANLPRFNNTVNNMVSDDNGAYRTLSEIISRIKSKIIKTIGSEIAGSYTINPVGINHVIPLERDLVTIN